MIGSRCPKCRGSRIRRGYKPTPLILRVFGIYNLLCDHCNLLFRGFALPGTLPKHGKRKRAKVQETAEEIAPDRRT